MLDKISNYVGWCLEIVTCWVFIILTLSVFLAIMDRFVIHMGFYWTEELARFSFIWLAFLSAAIIVYRRGHFNCSYFVDALLRERHKQILEIVVSGMMVGLMILLLIYGIKLAKFAEFQISPALGISMMYIYYSVPVSSVLMILFWVINIYRDVMKLKVRGSQS